MASVPSYTYSSFIFYRKDHAFQPITFADVTLPTGPETYDVWSSISEAVWRSLKLYELVVDGRKLEPGCNPEKTETYESLYHQVVGIYDQVVGSDILRQIIDLTDLHEMRKNLKSEYKRESSFALVFLFGKVIDLPHSSTSPFVSTLVQEIESEWLSISKLAGDSTDEYRVYLARCFLRDKAKRDFLLGMLLRIATLEMCEVHESARMICVDGSIKA